MTTLRIMKEYIKFSEAKHENIFIRPEESDVRKIKALVIGPSDTPYEGAILLFDIFAENYPNEPPKVLFTSPRGKEYIHPNLYPNGKVCLSILNTWGAKEWSPLLTFEKLLMTISGLLDNDPIAHEPGHRRCNIYPIAARYLCLILNMDIYIKRLVDNVFGDTIKEYMVKNKELYIKSIKILENYEGQNISYMHGSFRINLNNLRIFYKSL